MPCASTAPWESYQHSTTRDLAWLVFSPAMFDSFLGAYKAMTFDINREGVLQWLQDLDDKLLLHPELYVGILRQSHSRLGLYAESLLRFFWSEAALAGLSKQTLIDHNIQLKSGPNTLGECDFLLDWQGHCAVHVELAVKFYLQSQAGVRDWQVWIGPNAIDRLDIKLTRMINHQLFLLQRRDTASTLEAMCEQHKITPPIEARHLVKGYLFCHYNEASCVLAQGSNPSGLCGRWIGISDFLELSSQTDISGYLCEKMAWFTGPETNEVPLGAQDIIREMRQVYARATQMKKPPPGLMLRLQSNPGQPLMVVPDHWPETSSPLRKI